MLSRLFANTFSDTRISDEKALKVGAKERTFSEDVFGCKKSQDSPNLAFFEASLPPDFRDVHSSRFLFEDIRKFGLQALI